jgi:hypothetical protein
VFFSLEIILSVVKLLRETLEDNCYSGDDMLCFALAKPTNVGLGQKLLPSKNTLAYQA